MVRFLNMIKCQGYNHVGLRSQFFVFFESCSLPFIFHLVLDDYREGQEDKCEVWSNCTLNKKLWVCFVLGSLFDLWLEGPLWS